MSIHVALNHTTRYAYDRLVHLGPQLIRLRPAPHCRTRLLSYSLRIHPARHFLHWQQDPQANHLARVVFPERTTEFSVEVDLVCEMAVLNPFDFFLEAEAERLPFTYDATTTLELGPCLQPAPAGPLLTAWLASLDRTPAPTMDFLVALNQRLAREIRYLIRLEPGVQTPEETLARTAGSCRDSAWLLVQILRQIGLAARFVSGYLLQLVPDQPPLTGPAGPAADFTDLHAWCEVFLPGAGWVGLDPTSGLLAGEGHLPLACSPEPSSAAPVTGSVDECAVSFSHQMRVERIHEAPRVTRPYSDAQWAALHALGQQVEADLVAADVRLTQGGEPTFVAVEGGEAPEWSTEALGADKRRRATTLLAALQARYAPGGLVHQGQGKWYPGEVLPRWSLNLFWRADGRPLWREQSLLIADDAGRGTDTAVSGPFLCAVASRLGLHAERVMPAYEDLWYYLWRERRLPSNVEPQDSRLEDPVERERLRRVFTQGLGQTVGHVLPLARADDGWRSGSWFLRDDRCYLLPGDSPLGLRLPLDSLPWSEPDFREPALERDPVQLARQSSSPLPQSATLRPRPQVPGRALPRKDDTTARALVRTALCAEVRGGRLHLFLPPVEDLAGYLELLTAIELTAVQLEIPVVIEGYEPPRDPRLKLLRLTPDPGVLEVNVQPAAHWDELVDHTTFLYDIARTSGLSSEKFMLDGRHTGTGGGNHFVLGGATPLDSPFLRRPDLLGSMVAYWHNHPALSYLFSGLFIGPTSQAPRVDEARHESSYELEIALRELARQQQDAESGVPPWLVDRLFRHLLIDVTGNTHRAEFCIDKLFAPEQASGRLGLLELRAFEMPPHPQMSLAQQLLLRALVARFWRTPYRPPRLQRWGTALHDRFALPYFVAADFTDVLHELDSAGYPFDSAWFAPHFEFRFPRLGDFSAREVHVELRAALEPWHVLGEEPGAGGTARYVDSSLERLQVQVRGMVDDRHVLTCNGQVVPLHPTGSNGEFVAGVRYRAWQPPSCLQPTIGVHAPLVFDLVDTWLGRSLGGCQYHVAHPGGRNYVSFPVNAYEAEARRLARFFRYGHTPGSVMPTRGATSQQFPYTLDLRRPGD